MIDRSWLTEAEREILREALLDYVAQLKGCAPIALKGLQVSQKAWRTFQATAILQALDDR
jgi:hypothetical protein